MAERDGDGDKAKEPKGEEMSWTGVTSVWEFQASMVGPSTEGKDVVSREVGRYLEDASLGLRGGPGDSKASAQSETSKRVELLRHFLSSTNCGATASSLWWLVLSGIFHCVPEQVVEMARGSLGRSWHAFQLEVGSSLFQDLPSRQWILSSLPYVFAQVIFRMYFDGFPEDRHLTMNHSNNFLNNIMLVVHFEIMGFQINLDTARKLRATLFLRRVVENPQVNQTDFLAGQRRQAELELANLHTRPLQFGHLDAPPPDEIQLEHVLQAREDQRSGKNNWMASASTSNYASNYKKDLVPEELSVDRYLPLSTEGMAMLDRHISEMAHISGDVAEPDPAVAELDMELIDDYPELTTSTSMMRGTSTMMDDDGEDLIPLSPTSEDSLSFAEGKKAVRVRRARMAGHLSNMQKKANEKREEEAKMKRQRQQLLEQKLRAETLPERFRTTELNTTWVSPGMLSLHEGEDRDVMRLSKSSKFALKMAPKNPRLAGTTRSHRRGASKEETSPGQGDPLERGPMTRSALVRGGEALTLEPPWNLHNKVVYHRLDVATKTSQTHSFAMYAKEYDVFTGDLKQRFDEKRLRDEEDAYLKKMNSMVGAKTSKMKKLLYPGGDLGRRSKSTPSFRF